MGLCLYFGKCLLTVNWCTSKIWCVKNLGWTSFSLTFSRTRVTNLSHFTWHSLDFSAEGSASQETSHSPDNWDNWPSYRKQKTIPYTEYISSLYPCAFNPVCTQCMCTGCLYKQAHAWQAHGFWIKPREPTCNACFFKLLLLSIFNSVIESMVDRLRRGDVWEGTLGSQLN